MDGPSPDEFEHEPAVASRSSHPSGASASGWWVDRWAVALVFVALIIVFLPVVSNPGEMIYAPRSDVPAFMHPYRVLQNQSIAERGRITLFDPTSFAGRPLVGDPQAAIFYPPNWLHLLDVGGEGEAFFGWRIMLHLLIGGLGMLWWLRGSGLSPPARAAAAVVFMLCGKWLYHLTAQGHVIFLPIMWMPWQCGLIDGIWQHPTLRRVGLLALVLALIVVGCQPQLVLYSQLFVGTYALFVGLGGRSRHRTMGATPGLGLLALAGAALLALGLAAISILPVIGDLAWVVRGEGLDYETAASRALKPLQLLNLLQPIQMPYQHEPPPWAGVLAAPLAAFALFRPRSRALVSFCLGMLGFMVWYSLGAVGGLHRLLFDFVPGFDLFRIPARMFLILGLPLGVLVAAGIDALCDPLSVRPKRVLAAVLALVGASAAFRVGSPEIGWVVSAWLAPAVLLLPWPTELRRAAPWLLAALVFADLARFAVPQVETRSLAEVLGDNPVAERLRAPLGEGRVLAFNHRSSGDLSVLPATYATRAGIESIRGFNPLIPSGIHEYLIEGAAGGKISDRLRVTIPTFAIASRPHLDLLNVRWVVVNHVLEIDGLELRETFGPIDVFHYQLKTDHTTLKRTYLYENTRRMPRAALIRRAEYVADPTAAIEAVGELDPRQTVLVEDRELVGEYEGGFQPLEVDHGGDEIEISVDAGAGGYLLLSELYHPGWRVEESGRSLEIHRANGVFQVVRLGSGLHELHFRYRPTAYTVGRWLTLGSLLILGVSLRFG